VVVGRGGLCIVGVVVVSLLLSAFRVLGLVCVRRGRRLGMFGRSSIFFFFAPSFTAWVYLPSVTIIPLSTSASFMAFVTRFTLFMPTVVSPGTHHIRAFSFSLGMLTRYPTASSCFCFFKSL